MSDDEQNAADMQNMQSTRKWKNTKKANKWEEEDLND